MSRNESGGSTPVISVESLGKTYGDGEEGVTAVEEISFEIGSGTIVGLLGPNGAGKTTTIKSMLGLVVPDAGEVSVAGVDVYEHPERAHSHVGAMLEGDRNVYWRLTVRENLEYFAGLGGQWPGSVRDRHDELLERLDLADRADTVVNELSKGMKQKVSLASTLARDVDVVFLDEPTLGLDVETSQELHVELRRLAEEEDITIVLTSHDLDIIEAVSDRVIILDDGEVIADEETEELVDLFQTQSYQFTVDAPVRESVSRRLEREFDATCRTEGDTVSIDCFGADSDTVYRLVATLEQTGQKLRGVESVEPDLEEVFLKILDDGEMASSEGFGSGEADSEDSTETPTGPASQQPAESTAGGGD